MNRFLPWPQLTHALAQECVSEQGKSLCESMNGHCVTEQDGYYYVSAICIALGVLTLILYIIPTAKRLEGKPLHWFPILMGY